MDIVKYEENKKSAINSRTYYGVNVFRVNNVYNSLDPRVLFFQIISKMYQCYAHVGVYEIGIDSLGQYLIQHNIHEFSVVSTAVHGGYYFQKISSGGYIIDSNDNTFLIDNALYLLTYDAIALYVSSGDIDYNIIQQILNNQKSINIDMYDTRNHLLETLCSYLPIVIMSEADGWYITAYARDIELFNILDEPLNQVKNFIESSVWFQTFREKLRWIEDSDYCLKVIE